MQHFKSLIVIITLLLGSYIAHGQTMSIRINQCGYYPTSTKIALIVWTKASTFEVRKVADSSVVLTGNLSNALYYSEASDSLKQADFSSITSTGEYYINVTGEGKSLPFKIGNDVYRELAYASLKSFYFQRCSSPIDAKFGGLWARPAGHPDNNCTYHSSTGRTGKAPSVGGWYDAGDYGKYVVNAGISVCNLLQTYECFSWYFPDSSVIIPESGNGKNDLLDEVKYELDWLRTMQDADGGVFHKLTSSYFCGFVMPDADNLERLFIGKATPATLDFAAMMAMAGRIYAKTDSTWAAECIVMAEKAWTWAVVNPAVYFNNPSDISTGGYGDSNASDEFIWAAAELFTTTNKTIYSDYLMKYKSQLTYEVPGWGNVKALGLNTLATIPNKFDSAQLVKIKNSIVAKANALQTEINNNPSRITNTGYYWGCNGSYAEAGICMIYAYLLTKDMKYVKAAGEQIDYFFGKNALAQSFFTLYGNKSVMNPHHRPSGADKVVMPIPGFVSGGPSSGKEDNKTLYPYNPAAKSYIDSQDSYATNEVCINWNGPTTYLLAAVDAILGDSAKFTYAPILVVNNSPTVTLSKPIASSRYNDTATVTIAASATDADGIQKVEFYVDNKYLGTSTNKPYTWNVSGLTIGKHTVAAVAFDTKNKIFEKAALIEIVKNTTSVEKSNLYNEVIAVFPNPITENSSIKLKSKASGNATIQCVDASGRLIKSVSIETISGQEMELKIGDWNLPSNGVYNISLIQNDETISTTKLMKLK